MASLDSADPGTQQERTSELVETCWQMRGLSGQVFECAVYRSDTGLELGVRYDSHPVSAVPLATIDEGRARAATLKGLVLDKGGFDEVTAQKDEARVFARSARRSGRAWRRHV